MTDKFFILQNDLGSFNEIFMEDVPYDNIKSHKKTGFHPPFRRYIFRKTTGERGGGKFTGVVKLTVPPLPPSFFRVDFRLCRKFAWSCWLQFYKGEVLLQKRLVSLFLPAIISFLSQLIVATSTWKRTFVDQDLFIIYLFILYYMLTFTTKA